MSSVRVIARVRGGEQQQQLNNQTDTKPWISVSRPDSDSDSFRRVNISFHSVQTSNSGKQSYEVDECYEQNAEIFTREVQPFLISGLFGGRNSTVFAYGPRGSGKTFTIQGSEEERGLVMLTMDAILPRAQEEGKEVTVSVFEVCQDRIVDILGSKRSDVSVFEDGQGKIMLKGLSEVKVNCAAEFERVYCSAANTMDKRSHRSHVGCILNIVAPATENAKAQLVAKMTFVDLASYEDSRRKSTDSSDLAEATKIKKSLHAVHNVLYALNSKERCVPYRESKLTRMLQDSLGGMSKILMITCMNPFFCQDTVQTISLASRSCIASFLAHLDPGKSGRIINKPTRMSPQAPKSASKLIPKTNLMSSPIVPKSASKSLARTNIMTSPQVPKSGSKTLSRANMMSPKVMKPISSSASGRKQDGTQLRVSMRKPIGDGGDAEAKGKKLLVGSSQSKNSNLGKPTASESPAGPALPQVHASVKSEVTVDMPTQEEEKPSASLDMDSTTLPSEKARCALSSSADTKLQLPLEEDVKKVENNSVTETLSAFQTPGSGDCLVEDVDKENKYNSMPSPPLSARLKELSNNLKSLCISTEANLKMTQDSSSFCNQVIHETLEPKTPVFQRSARAHDKCEIASHASPWESFHMRSSGMKDSLVQEYLQFVNSASKEELKRLKGIGEKRATYIVEMREESPEPFKKLDDLMDIGLSEKQIKGMMKNLAGNLFT